MLSAAGSLVIRAMFFGNANRIISSDALSLANTDPDQSFYDDKDISDSFPLVNSYCSIPFNAHLEWQTSSDREAMACRRLFFVSSSTLLSSAVASWKTRPISAFSNSVAVELCFLAFPALLHDNSLDCLDDLDGPKQI